MKSLEARVAALEERRPAPNVRYVVTCKPDGSIVKLRPGAIWNKHVALMPAPCATVDEWLQTYVPREGDSRAGLLAIIERACEQFRLTRLRDGNLAGTKVRR